MGQRMCGMYVVPTFLLYLVKCVVRVYGECWLTFAVIIEPISCKKNIVFSVWAIKNDEDYANINHLEQMLMFLLHVTKREVYTCMYAFECV